MIVARALLASFVLTLASAATAGEPTEADKNRAAELVYVGDEKRAAGDHAAALRSYEEADAIVRVPTTGIEVARELAALGRLVEARAAAARVIEHPSRRGEAVAFARARKEASVLASAMDARMSTLVVRVSGEPAAELTVDGRVVQSGTPFSVDPGTHVVAARAGDSHATKTISLTEGENREVDLQIASGVVEGEGRTVASAAKRADRRVTTDSRGGGSAGTLVWVGFGTAAVGAVLGTATGIMAFSVTTDLEADCDGRVCPTHAGGDIDRAVVLSHLSTVSFAVGGAGACLGVVALLWPRDRAATRRTSTHVIASPRFLGASGSF